MLEATFREIRLALRSLIARPGFSSIVVLTLALGIGANAAIFSVVDGVLLKPLPYAQPDRLVRMWSAFPSDGLEHGTTSPLDLDDWRRRAVSFDAISGYPAITLSGLVIGGVDGPDELRAMHVTEDFFETLGVNAELGRTLRGEDQQESSNRVAVLSHASWRQRFGADVGIVGEVIQLNGEPFSIVGVMPSTFSYPVADVELWVPVSVIPESGIPRLRPVRWMNVVARLAPDTSIAQARAEMTAVAAGLAQEYPDSNERLTTVTIEPLRDQLVGDVRPAVLTVFAAVGFVLLIACANVANLVLARADSRRREMSIRAALGAGRGRLLVQVLVESLVLSAIGALLGIGVAFVGLQFLLGVAPDSLPRLAEIGINTTVLLFSLVLSVLSGGLVGMFPALRVSLQRPGAGLRTTVGGVDRVGRRFRGALVVGEITLVVVLAIGAGLLIRSYNELLRVEPGFDTEGVLTLRVSAQASDGYVDFLSDAVDRVAALPGVEAAGMIRPLPLRADTFQGESLSFDIAGREAAADADMPTAYMRFAGPGYFRAMGIPQLAGRDFRASDDVEAPMVVIVSRSFAEKYWGGRDPVGDAITVGDREIRIVGMVGDVRQTALSDAPAPALYVAHRQVPRTGMSIVVRLSGDSATVIAAIQQEIWALRSDQPLEDIATMGAVVGESVAQPRFAMALLSLFAGLALVLAVVGVYGVISYTVGTRGHEIGIRIALGARPGDVQRLVINGAAALTVLGIGAGLATAAGTTWLMRSLLFDVPAVDPLTFATVAALLFAVSLTAALIPALRAARHDPLSTIRGH